MSNRSCGISACIGDDDNLQFQVISNFSSRDFAIALKEIQETTYGAGPNKRTGNVVTGFDTLGFTKFCDKSSPSYEAHYCNYDELGAELFQPNEVWISRDLLLEAMEMLAKYHGFTVCCEKEFIKCNRQGKDKSSREYLNGALKSGCTFQLKFTYRNLRQKNICLLVLKPRIVLKSRKRGGDTKSDGTDQSRLFQDAPNMVLSCQQVYLIESLHHKGLTSTSTTCRTRPSFLSAIIWKTLVD